MKYRKLTSSYDYSFGNNAADYLNNFDSIVQAIKTKILLFYGEWWESLGIGIPMLTAIVGQVNSEALRQSASLLIEKRILEVDGVTSVTEVQVLVSDRSLSFTAVVETEYGTAEVEVNM